MLVIMNLCDNQKNVWNGSVDGGLLCSAWMTSAVVKRWLL
jgi:hypothetical protein